MFLLSYLLGFYKKYESWKVLVRRVRVAQASGSSQTEILGDVRAMGLWEGGRTRDKGPETFPGLRPHGTRTFYFCVSPIKLE